MILTTGLSVIIRFPDQFRKVELSAKDTNGSRASSDPLAPLYQRLPHGPHRLEPDVVIRHQRARMHGAMIEAVAANGYERTSVKQVVGLAGVSRRSFYEQFTNKQDCFLATFDVIAARGAARVSAAYRGTEGHFEVRMKAAFDELGEAMRADWKATGLAILEAPTVGTAGMLRLRRATATFEQMLSSCFERAPDASALPGPVVRGIAGGLHAAMWMCVREGSVKKVRPLAQDMLEWTLAFQTPASERLAERLAQRAQAGLLNGRKPAEGHGPGGARPPARDERERLLEHALRLVVTEDYRELSAPQIADAAELPIDAFFEYFKDKQACLLAALDMIGEQLLELTADPDLLSADWTCAVRRVIRDLGCYLAGHPVYAATIASGAFAGGPEAVERIIRLTYTIAWRLTRGAPGEPRGGLAIDGVAGALAHTVRCQVASGQIELLAVLSDYIAYIVLAPYIGAEEAATLVAEKAA
jgi:TetR/AcrR family transcriptional regulator